MSRRFKIVAVVLTVIVRVNAKIKSCNWMSH
jgi:hypothetical protein